jgi:integrase
VRREKARASHIRSYQEHIGLHILPRIGAKRLAELNAPSVNAFADRLREDGRSPEMVRRVVKSLGAIFREARRRGLSATDPTAGLDLHLPGREDPRPVAPTKAELQAIIAGATGKWRPLVLTAIFAGLRASELRGLRWQDVDFEGRQINVSQRADIFRNIGRLKSKSAYRSIPLPVAGPERAEGMETPVSEGRSRAGVSVRNRQRRFTVQHQVPRF